MKILVILGAIAVVAGLVGLAHCVRVGYAIKREKPAPEVVRAQLGLDERWEPLGAIAVGYLPDRPDDGSNPPLRSTADPDGLVVEL